MDQDKFDQLVVWFKTSSDYEVFKIKFKASIDQLEILVNQSIEYFHIQLKQAFTSQFYKPKQVLNGNK